MISRIGLLITLVVATLATPLFGGRGGIYPSMNDRRYTEVRARLIAIGYRPVRTEDRGVASEAGLARRTAGRTG